MTMSSRNPAPVVLFFGIGLGGLGMWGCGSSGGDGGGDGDRPDAGGAVQVDCRTAQTLDHDIDTDTTLSVDCYRVTDKIGVSAALMLDPGTVLEFETGTGLKIADGGSISALGSEAAPILLTSAEGIAGDWSGLVLDSSSPDNELDHVIVEHAGTDDLSFNGNTSANLILMSGARAAVTSSTFARGSEYGVAMDSGAELLAFDDNEFVENEGPPMQLNSKQIGYIGGGNVFGTGAAPASAYVRLEDNSTGSLRSTTEDTQTWPALDVPYRFFGKHFIDDAAAVVTIEAGAELEFDEGAGLRVNDGALKALGTADEPVVFTAARKEPGEWSGLVISSSSPDTELDFVNAEYGGAQGLGFNGNTSGSLILVEGARASVTSSTFAHGSEYGVAVASGAELLAFEDNEFIANEGPPMKLNSKQIGYIGGGNVFGTDAASGSAYVELLENSTGTDRSTTESSQTWPALDVPYRFFGSHFIDDAAAVVTIEAGAELEFAQDAGLRVDAGALEAIGTDDKPVTFTGAEKLPGAWRGLVIESRDGNDLRHIIAEYGGDQSLGFNGNTSANVIVADGARSIIIDSEFRHSSGHGIHSEGTILDQNETEIDPDGGGNSFGDNADGDFNAGG